MVSYMLRIEENSFNHTNSADMWVVQLDSGQTSLEYDNKPYVAFKLNVECPNKMGSMSALSL